MSGFGFHYNSGALLASVLYTFQGRTEDDREATIKGTEPNNEVKKVLIFPAGSEVGLEIFECLQYSTYYQAVGASSIEDHSSFIYSELFYLPHFESINFLDDLIELIQKENLDFIYPAMDEVASILKQYEPQLGIKVIGSPHESYLIANNKETTYKFFDGKIRVPEVLNKEAEIEFPVFLKPKIGYGSRGTAIISDKEQLDFHFKNPDQQLLLEFLPGEEFTVDCFTDNSRILRYCSPRTRSRIKMGISVNSTFCSESILDELLPMAEKINSLISIRSAWFFQVKYAADREFVLMEIGLRPAGSSGLNRLKDVNLTLLSIFDYDNFKVQIDPRPINGTIDRAFSTKARIDLNFNQLFIDLDDCIIFNNRLNSKAIELIIHCHNSGKEVCLITKHKGDLAKTLSDFKITSLFDRVIHLNKEQKKKDYILPNSLFVDDSFAERQDAMGVKNVITYGNESLSLLNSQFIL